MPVEDVYYGKKPDGAPEKKDDGWEDADGIVPEEEDEPEADAGDGTSDEEVREDGPSEADAPEEDGEDAE
jgi:hypothetical protein